MTNLFKNYYRKNTRNFYENKKEIDLNKDILSKRCHHPRGKLFTFVQWYTLSRAEPIAQFHRDVVVQRLWLLH